MACVVSNITYSKEISNKITEEGRGLIKQMANMWEKDKYGYASGYPIDDPYKIIEKYKIGKYDDYQHLIDKIIADKGPTKVEEVVVKDETQVWMINTLIKSFLEYEGLNPEKDKEDVLRLKELITFFKLIPKSWPKIAKRYNL
jgi:hypothetical protein